MDREINDIKIPDFIPEQCREKYKRTAKILEELGVMPMPIRPYKSPGIIFNRLVKMSTSEDKKGLKLKPQRSRKMGK